MIRVVQLNTTDVIGGAALAANRLHHALNQHGGVDSTMFVAMAQSQDAKVVEFRPVPWGTPWLNRAAFRLGRRLNQRFTALDHTLFTLDWTTFGRLPVAQLPAADICHLHWTTDLLDFRMLPILGRRMPLVWTMHDMNSFTGGCHYDHGCGGFTDRCGKCPVIGSTEEEDVSRRVLRRKQMTLSTVPDSRLTLVSPSRWLADEARRSKLFGRFESCVIPNGIDTEFFRPTDPAEARRRLGLDAEERVVLFVADYLNDRRKGWSELKKALLRITHVPRLRILTLGGGEPPDLPDVPFCRLGRVSDPATIRDAYNAADVFIMPSLQDNFPNTVIESLACGTPVVGFAIGGVVDAVKPGVTGLLARAGDTEELAAHLLQVLSEPGLREAMGRAAREQAVARFTLSHQAAAYRALYERLLQDRSAPTAGLPAHAPVPPAPEVAQTVSSRW